MIRTQKLYMKVCKQSKDLHTLTQEERMQLQQHLRQMYVEVERICSKHHLDVMLAYGSILGAVRHEGFIPWDDDIDLYMPRKDYDLFFSKYAKELPENYITYAPNLLNGPIYRFGKIVDKDTLLLPPGEENRKHHKGIYIDVFPLENIGRNKLINQIKRLLSLILIYISGSVAQYENKSDIYKKLMLSNKTAAKNYRFRHCLGLIFSFCSSQRWYNIFDKFCRHTKETGFVYDPSGAYSWNPIPINKVLPVRKVSFDDIEANIPNDPIYFLERDFGNWEYIPKPEERWEHFIMDIKFKL